MSFSFRNLFSPDENSDAFPPTGRATPDMVPQNVEGAGTHHEYQVAELLPFLPPAIAAQGDLPLSDTVRIRMPEDGSRDVRLSTIYQVCPALFASEITPLNDSTINLPPRMNPKAHGQPVPSEFNPFGDSVIPETAMVASAENNPSESSPPSPWSDGVATPSNPFANHPLFTSPGNGSVQKSASPFGAAPEKPLNPFVDGLSFDQIFEPQKDTPPSAQMPPAPSLEPFEKTKAPNVPKQNPFETTTGNGFSSLFSPPAATSNPLKPQLADPAIEESSPSFKTQPFAPAFLEVEKENNPPQLPDKAIGKLFKEATGEYVAGMPAGHSPFDFEAAPGVETFIPPGMENTEDPSDFIHPPQVSWQDEPESFFTPPSSGVIPPVKEFRDETMDSLASVPEQADRLMKSAPALDFQPSTPIVDNPHVEPEKKIQPLPEAPPKSQSQQEELGSAADSPSSFNILPEENPTPKAATIKEQPSEQQVPAIKADHPKGSINHHEAMPTAKIQHQPRPAKSEPISEPQKQTETKQSSATFTTPENLPLTPTWHAMMLKAIFSTDDNFDLRKVSQKIATLEGIFACAIVTPDRVIEACAASKYAIGAKLQSMAEHIKGLAPLSEVGDANYLTLQMADGSMTFFFAEKNILAVKHESSAFKNGTREKLIMVTRAIDSLED